MTEWFTKRPGGPLAKPDGLGGAMIVLGGQTPDRVRLPAQLGGHVERVKRAFTGPCPSCSETCWHFTLETLSVAECSCAGFLWYRRSG